MRRIILIGLMSCATIACSMAQSVSNDFSTDNLPDYIGNTTGAGGNYTWASAVGTGNSGGIQVPANGEVMTYSPTTFDFSFVGTTISSSLDFLYDDLFTTGGGNQIGRVGFAQNLGSPFDTTSLYAGVGNNPDAGNVLSWNLQGTLSEGTDGNTDFDAAFVSGNWYRMQMDGTVTSPSVVDMVVTVFDIGASGLSTPVALDDVMVNRSIGGLSSDTTWHAGFKARGDKGGVVLDNHTATVTTPTTFLSATIDRTNGQLTLENTDTAKTIVDYSISSDAGWLDATEWLSIADNYDADSGGIVDPDDTWTITSSTETLLSESTSGSATISTGQTVDLGNAWIAGPFEDVVVTMTLDDMSTLTVPVFYTGNGDNQFAIGDLDVDGDLDGDDWAMFRSGQGAALSGPASTTYFSGDLDFDGDNDVFDFVAFQNAYDAANGAGAFNQLVPEPSSLSLIHLSCFALLHRWRQRSR